VVFLFVNSKITLFDKYKRVLEYERGRHGCGMLPVCNERGLCGKLSTRYGSPHGSKDFGNFWGLVHHMLYRIVETVQSVLYNILKYRT
jgi:hypothetical protein